MTFKVDFELQNESMIVNFGEMYGIMPDEYEGPYIVVPKLDEETILLTDEKLMSDDVTVRKIPWLEVSNPQGGITVTIG